jgi:hypothetical protein
MTENNPTPQFEDEIRAALASPDAPPAFVENLRLKIRARSAAQPQRSTRSFKLRLVWAISLAVLLVLIVTTLLIGPQQVLAAVRGLFGYIPGIGVVQNDASLRVLAKPASQERQGIIVQVQQGAADNQHTVLVYQVNGLSVAAANSQGEGAGVGGVVSLLLPDGMTLAQNGGEGSGWGTGYQWRTIFPAIPANINEVTLLITRLLDMPAGAAPEDWRIPLHFKPAPTDLKVMPVYELATPQKALSSQTPGPAVQSQSTKSGPSTASQANVSMQHGIQFSLDKVIELEDGYLFQGSVSWKGQQDISFVDVNLFQMKAEVNGQTIPIEESQPDQYPGQPTEGSTTWAVRTNTKSSLGPWTLTQPSIIVHNDTDVPFQIDFGADPQFGQTWQMDRELDVNGYKLHLISAKLAKNPDGTINLNISFENNPSVLEVLVSDPNNYITSTGGGGGGGGGGGSGNGELTSSFEYGRKPTGLHTMIINMIGYTLNGPWQVIWNPPAGSGQPLTTPTSQPQLCLNDDKWQKLKNQPPAPVSELKGRLLLAQNTGQLMPQMSLINTDGSQRQDIAIGGLSALSPDGSTIAFIKSNGPSLFLVDTHTQEIRPLQGSGKDDYQPVWSLDGKWIAFTRSSAGVFIIHPDGSGLKQITNSSTLSFPVGWMPDNQRLVISTLGPDGSTVQIVQVETGKKVDQFVINNRKGGFVQLSPDGKRVSYSEEVFGQPQYGIWIANLDGSNKRLVAVLGNIGLSSNTWSPDSQWLALTAVDWNGTNDVETPLFIQPDTCQVVPLQGVSGQITSWVKSQP